MLFFKKSFIDEMNSYFAEYRFEIDSASAASTRGVMRLKLLDIASSTEYIGAIAFESLGADAYSKWSEVLDEDIVAQLVELEKAGRFKPAVIIVPNADAEAAKRTILDRGLHLDSYDFVKNYTVIALRKYDCEELLKKALEPKVATKTNTDSDTLQLSIEESWVDKPLLNKPLFDEPSWQLDPLIKKLLTAALIGISLALGAVFVYMMFVSGDPIIYTYENRMAETKNRFVREIKIGRAENSELKKALLSHPKVSKSLIYSASVGEELYEVVKNPYAPRSFLQSALNSNDEMMRANLALNDNLPTDYYKKLSKDESELVRSHLATNPSITRDIMRELSRDTTFVRDSLIENSQLIEELFDAAIKNHSESCEFNRKLLASSTVMVTRLRANEKSTDPCVRMGVAKNINAPVDIINRYTKDNDKEVRRYALMNPNISEDILRSYFNHPLSYEPTDLLADRLAILSNPKTPKDIFEQTILNEPNKYGIAVAKNPSAPKELINILELYAVGREGLERFITEAFNIKNSDEALTQISNAMRKEGSTIAKPLKQYINKLFIDNLYDPNMLNDYMQRYQNYASTVPTKNLSDKNMGKDKLRFNDMNISMSDTAVFALPVNFTDNNDERNIVKSSNFVTTTDVAIVLADNIVYTIFRNVLPDIESVMHSKRLMTNGEAVSKIFTDSFVPKSEQDLYRTFSKMTDEMNKYFDQ